MGHGVGIIDAVDLGGLHEHLCADLAGAKCGCRICRKVGIAGACGKDGNAFLLEVPDGATADVGLGDLVHLDGAHDAALHPVTLESVL